MSNDTVSLEPITREHIEELKYLGGDPDMWRWFTADLTEPKDLEEWMMARFNESEAKDKMTFAVRLKKTGRLVGSSSYGHIDWKEKSLEIGWTWIAADYIGKGINKHMKFLMLSHAFENLDIERLELRTDEINIRSRKAIEKIGAQLDATLRSHRYTRGDRRRNTVVYSIIKDEWPEIKRTIFKEF